MCARAKDTCGLNRFGQGKRRMFCREYYGERGKRRHGLILLLVSGLSLLFLGGCWDVLEVDRRGLYTGVGFDLTPDGQIKLTAEFPKTETFTKGPAASQGPQAVTLSATGRTAWEAHTALESRTRERACICQLKVVILGEDVARQGMFQVLDFIERMQKYDRYLVVLVAKNAEAVLRAKPSQYHVSSLYIWSFYRRPEIKQQTTFYMPLWRLMVLVHEPALEPVLPYVEVHGNDLYLRGLAIFKGDRMVARLTPREARGLLWARQGRGVLAPVSQVRAGTLEVPWPGRPGGRISLGLLKSKGEAEVSYANGKPAARLKVRVSGNVMEGSDGPLRLTPGMYKKIEVEAARLIRQEIARALAICQEKNADAFGLAESFRAAYPKEWTPEMWERVFPTLPVDIQVQVRLKKSGLLW